MIQTKQNGAGVNFRFATISEAERLKIQEDAIPENTKKAKIVLLRSLRKYIQKQLFFEIEVNSG